MVSPTNKLPTPKSQQTYQRIIEAAIDCFFEAGFHASNMSSIAARAGVSRGRVQYYFATTEQLLMDAANALLMRLWGRYLGEVFDPDADGDEAFDRFMALRNDRGSPPPEPTRCCGVSSNVRRRSWSDTR
jgi:AcrR family transcriptional regulator